MHRGASSFGAQPCTILIATRRQKMNGRFFGGRAIAAFTYDNQKYKQSGKGPSLEGTGFEDDAADGQTEQERLERYSEWLEKGGE